MRKIQQIPETPSGIALVGEAPGEEEDRYNEPFVGPEGRYLNKLLKAAGISRDDLYITNVAHQKPHKNKFEMLPKEVIEEGKLQLNRDLRDWKPNVVIACGAKALEALTGHTAIFAYRGAFLESSIIPGLKVLPTLHPGALIKGSGKYEPIVANDLVKARKDSDFPEIIYPTRDVEIIRNIHEANDLLRQFTDMEHLIAADIESTKLSGEMTAYGIATSKSKAYSITKECLQAPSVLRSLSEFCASSTPKMFHNASFDVLHNALYYNIMTRNIAEDTMLRQHAVMPVMEKNLGFCASIYTREPYWKDEGKDTFEQLKSGGVVDWDSLYIYNGKDCCLTYEIYEAQASKLDHWGTREIYQLMMDLLPPYLRAMYTGLRIDNSKMNEFAEENEKAIENLYKILHQVVGDYNPRSTPQKKKLFYEEWKLPKRYDKGKVSTSSESMETLERLPTPHKPKIGLVRHIMEYEQRRNFYKMKIDEDNRLRYALKITGTYTGRPASTKSITGSGTNMLNQPKEVRKFYVPDEGQIFIQMDLSQVDARIVAALCKDDNWLRQFDEEDLHTSVASMLFGIPKEKVRKEFERQTAKRVQHAANYLLGDDHLSRMLKCPMKDAKQHKENYFAIRPKLLEWHDWVENLIKKYKFIRTCYGRVIQFPGPVTRNTVTSAVAAEPQSTAADYLNYGIKRVYEEGPEEFDFKNQVYDSILCQVPNDIECVTRTVQSMQELTEQTINVRGVPLSIPCEFEIGFDWKNLEEMEDTSRTEIERVFNEVQ